MLEAEILVYLLMALSGVASTIAVYLAMIERDLVKAVIYSAIQSTLYSLLFYLLMAPDIVLVYLPVSVGLIPGVFLLLISRTERREKD